MRFWFAVLLAVLAAPAAAQLNPGTPVRMIIGYPPGGSADFTARHLADEMGRELGNAVIVDNRPGAGTMLASDAVAKARPDGHTLLLNWHQVIVRALLKESLPYDPERDLVPVTRVATGANVLVVNNSVPAKNLAEFIAWMRANPGRINAASGGYGSAPHIAMAAFELAVGAKFHTIQYKGGGPAVQSILAGDTQVLFASAPSVMGHIKAGKLRPLVVTTRAASPSIPGVPGSAEAGLPDYESTFWFGLFAPAGTAPATLGRLHQAAAAALGKPEVRARVAAGGMDATPSPSQAAFAAEVAAEGPRLERLMQALGAKID
ncbi:MAG: tripartite tricarboxylate transporter substrate binding protein [Burkholderiales bacterium]|nr:tripartite tricarboxylate transporter substrate binding protein [Burkholderiales bacterium]